MRLRSTMAALVHDQRGVAAIEFAFIVPILLCMYFMTMEISQAIVTSKKLGRAGNLVGDLITQQDAKISSDDIDAILKIGEALLQPYNRTDPVITVTAINVGPDPRTKKITPKVLWSRKMETLPGAEKETFAAAGPANANVPETLLVDGTFLIRVDAELNYTPVLLNAARGQAIGVLSAFDSLSMNETYFMRPRRSTTIECTNC